MRQTFPALRLVELCSLRSSGELICSSELGEIHVYLQRGRLAWATDSTHPFAFAAYLRREENIDADTLRHVVDECRKHKLPLGETLVAWKLVTWDRVRAALLHQINLALDVLGKASSGETLFLPRTYDEYDQRLIFGLDELDFDLRRASAEPESTPPAPAMGSDLPHRLRSSIEGLEWVETLENARPVEPERPHSEPRTPEPFVRSTLLDGADFVALRARGHVLVGIRLTSSRSVWCQVAASSTLGGVISAVCAVAERDDADPPDRGLPTSAQWRVGGDHSAIETLGAFGCRAQEVLAALVLPTGGSAAPTAGWGTLDLDLCTSLGRRRSTGLQHAPVAEDGPARWMDSVGFGRKSLVTGESGLWCCGMELGTESTLWLFLRRDTPQGLAWAYMTSVGRALARAEGSAHG